MDKNKSCRNEEFHREQIIFGIILVLLTLLITPWLMGILAWIITHIFGWYFNTYFDWVMKLFLRG